MLLSLVYVSCATQRFDQHELAALLQSSRRNNASREITGLLLHVGGNFMQALEGPETPVDELYRQIAADPRHRWVHTIVRVPIAERSFPDWAMGFPEADLLPPDVRMQISSFLDDAARREVPETRRLRPPALALLRRFALTMR